MGKSDAVVMREKLNIALDESQDVNERVFALDDFEMVRVYTRMRLASIEPNDWLT